MSYHAARVTTLNNGQHSIQPIQKTNQGVVRLIGWTQGHTIGAWESQQHIKIQILRKLSLPLQ